MTQIDLLIQQIEKKTEEMKNFLKMAQEQEKSYPMLIVFHKAEAKRSASSIERIAHELLLEMTRQGL